ncbi:MAG: hypothetical protein JHD07_08935 [Bradyrhizobium sp.]|jgi:hypothetical protein|uniref:hypothetical protein n=1 Tax=Bradyrhizobium sp. TaxID=376 RepID=UPI001A2E9A93|nr:hypothetical protein [Bradyrhizobium sp.]MBJ7403403.1 hypothetical protein [Bradyrhizobium sp.]
MTRSERIAMQPLGPEQTFIVGEIWTLAWAASVQRANLYVAGSKQTQEFRAKIKDFVGRDLLPHYESPCTESQHYQNIALLVEFGTRAIPDILRDGNYRYGVAQKLLNLALKYYWCLGHIPAPPHCPVDRIIIEKTPLRGRVNWTEIKDEAQYREVIEAIRQIAGSESLARWELLNYSRR